MNPSLKSYLLLCFVFASSGCSIARSSDQADGGGRKLEAPVEADVGLPNGSWSGDAYFAEGSSSLVKASAVAGISANAVKSVVHLPTGSVSEEYSFDYSNPGSVIWNDQTGTRVGKCISAGTKLECVSDNNVFKRNLDIKESYMTIEDSGFAHSKYFSLTMILKLQ